MDATKGCRRGRDQLGVRGGSRRFEVGLHFNELIALHYRGPCLTTIQVVLVALLKADDDTRICRRVFEFDDPGQMIVRSSSRPRFKVRFLACSFYQSIERRSRELVPRLQGFSSSS